MVCGTPSEADDGTDVALFRWKWKSYGRPWLILDLIVYFGTLLSISANGLLYNTQSYLILHETDSMVRSTMFPVPASQLLPSADLLLS